MSNLTKHLKTIRTHRKYVRRMCFKMGIPFQGLVHDLSKYSLAELKIAKYYVGTKSPHQVAREQVGFSSSWNHHYHRNKHHFQFWWDEDEMGRIIPVKMPFKYVIESFCDMVGAGKAYSGSNWTCHAPLQYYIDKCEGTRIMNKQSEKLLVYLLNVLNDYGEKDFLKWYKINKKEIKRNYNNEQII